MSAGEDRSRPPVPSAVRGVLALVLLCTAGGAGAEPPHARLVYVRGAGAERCPDEAALRQAVSRRLGYDPFIDDAPRTLFARLSATRRALLGALELRDEGGVLLGAHQLTFPSPECQELSAALELAIALAIDPLSAARPTPPDVVREEERVIEREEPAPLVALASQTPPPQPSPSARKPELHGDLGVHATVGSAPAPSWGLTLGLDLRWGRWALGFQVRGDLPATQETTGGAIGSSVVMAQIVP